jgi:hypothetical protein
LPTAGKPAVGKSTVKAAEAAKGVCIGDCGHGHDRGQGRQREEFSHGILLTWVGGRATMQTVTGRMDSRCQPRFIPACRFVSFCKWSVADHWSWRFDSCRVWLDPCSELVLVAI